jgi:hypothetical protein
MHEYAHTSVFPPAAFACPIRSSIVHTCSSFRGRPSMIPTEECRPGQCIEAPGMRWRTFAEPPLGPRPLTCAVVLTIAIVRFKFHRPHGLCADTPPMTPKPFNAQALTSRHPCLQKRRRRWRVSKRGGRCCAGFVPFEPSRNHPDRNGAIVSCDDRRVG